ncbi:hypothetical protein MCAP1_002310 [Malassezia caprae]|uniref:Uncharacterized protein n=1 Tax=Malassezia caprae TaxID=1381934 RepID=A0AAF0E845_9BASI|nr:hypothetical protein MCAP1_002310 [Malassezia caprae]
MSTRGPAASGKPHDYKAHFTRTRSKYEKVIERQRELQKHATDAMSKQQNLQDEVDFLLDALLDVQAKAGRGELAVLPPSARPKPAERADALPGPSASRNAPTIPTATEYSDDDMNPDLTVDIAIEEDAGVFDTLAGPSSSPPVGSQSKRPRMSTPQGEDAPSTETASDARPGSPKRPRLT